MNFQIQDTHHINLTVALPAEAKPLRKAFGLMRQQPIESMPIYTGNGIHLCVTGPGTSAASLGVQLLKSITPADVRTLWLNCGICGHGSLPIGESLWVDRVIDLERDKSWSLQTRLPIAAITGPLSCVQTPTSDYQQDMAYDMESAGFVESVSAIDRSESITIIKIVSDNPDQPSRGISAKLVQDLFEKQISLIHDLVDQLEHQT
ncbi:MAG: hypothetical protein KZQ66_18880 [Candidatus Thiodiazotropha sp. (ex Lucinoma aequizonata)]|nr:hypothetical protein [Candidatus Thiodiazotropha sp. (ex Lucinoma aequizonata)]MCU7887248.1 hypothetical protein [Candidatus Thiodiazotropha sp. (ex Lucinoma aequizonata)]MCU7903784.1 hypothetical protein [Candidatus Thiodiazotropha sp. (ex Lucinoma aequizonata)]MCU7913017.1 hypothetical protein [Candidatus Thiodiazotropha sp. (ex Lucinoma aequizonata)]